MRRLSITVVIVLTLCICNYAFSQEGVPEQPIDSAQVEPEVIYDFGEVVSVNPETNELTMQHYDYETNELKEAKFVLNSNSKLENVNKLSEIAPGDTVYIEHVKEGDLNSVIKIYVEKTNLEDFPSDETQSEE